MPWAALMRPGWAGGQPRGPRGPTRGTVPPRRGRRRAGDAGRRRRTTTLRPRRRSCLAAGPSGRGCPRRDCRGQPRGCCRLPLAPRQRQPQCNRLAGVSGQRLYPVIPGRVGPRDDRAAALKRGQPPAEDDARLGRHSRSVAPSGRGISRSRAPGRAPRCFRVLLLATIPHRRASGSLLSRRWYALMLEEEAVDATGHEKDSGRARRQQEQDRDPWGDAPQLREAATP